MKLRRWIPLVGVAFVVSCGGGEPTVSSTVDSELLAQGADLYQANCATCHGVDLRGTDQGPSHLSEVYEPNHHGDEAFQRAVLLGSQQHHWTFGAMPPVAGLDRSQVTAIVAFVREQQQSEGFEPYPP